MQRVVVLKSKPHPRIPLPLMLYGTERRNALAVDLTDPLTLRRLKAKMEAVKRSWKAAPRVAGKIADTGIAREIKNPADRRRAVGWIKMADGMEDAMPELLHLCIPKAGKTVTDAVAEVREAVDFWAELLSPRDEEDR